MSDDQDGMKVWEPIKAIGPYLLGVHTDPTEMTPYSDWVCIWLGPNGRFTVRPLQGEVPSWFRRWLLTLLIGVKWKKLKARATS